MTYVFAASVTVAGDLPTSVVFLPDQWVAMLRGEMVDLMPARDTASCDKRI